MQQVSLGQSEYMSQNGQYYYTTQSTGECNPDTKSSNSIEQNLLGRSDSINEEKLDEKLIILKDYTNKDVFKMSSVTGKGITSILRILHDNISKTEDDDIKGWQP